MKSLSNKSKTGMKCSPSKQSPIRKTQRKEKANKATLLKQGVLILVGINSDSHKSLSDTDRLATQKSTNTSTSQQESSSKSQDGYERIYTTQL